MKSFFLLFLFFGLMKITPSSAQTPSGYKLPDSFQFDYTVTQTVHHAKKVPDSSVMHFFYTKSGDYAGAEISRNAEARETYSSYLPGKGTASSLMSAVKVLL